MHGNHSKLTPSQLLVFKKLNQCLSKKNTSQEVIHDEKKWIRNSYASWQKLLGLYSTKTIQRAFSKLEELNLVQSRTFEDGKNLKGGE
ncbi:MAG: hypothetical protein C0425_11355 [Chlorobiaceae bacterium]|nr:hypothetical protein [Chlorobiaceae bacterium]